MKTTKYGSYNDRVKFINNEYFNTKTHIVSSEGVKKRVLLDNIKSNFGSRVSVITLREFFVEQFRLSNPNKKIINNLFTVSLINEEFNFNSHEQSKSILNRINFLIPILFDTYAIDVLAQWANEHKDLFYINEKEFFLYQKIYNWLVNEKMMIPEDWVPYSFNSIKDENKIIMDCGFSIKSSEMEVFKNSQLENILHLEPEDYSSESKMRGSYLEFKSPINEIEYIRDLDEASSLHIYSTNSCYIDLSESYLSSSNLDKNENYNFILQLNRLFVEKFPSVFKAKFINFNGENIQEVKSRYLNYKAQSVKEDITSGNIYEYIKWIKNICSKNNYLEAFNDNLNQINECILSVPINEKLSFKEWSVYLYNFIQRKRTAYKLKSGFYNLSELNQFYSVGSSESIVVGACQEWLYAQSKSVCDFKTQQKINSDTGLFLNTTLNESPEKIISYLDKCSALKICTPSTSLKNNPLQTAEFIKKFNKIEFVSDSRNNYVKQEKKSTDKEVIDSPLFKSSFSASSLKSYKTCPFKFKMEKVNRFQEVEDNTTVLSPKYIGIFSHHILKLLGDKDFSEQLDFNALFDKELDEFIKLNLIPDYHRLNFDKYRKLILRIYNHEIQLRKLTNTKTVATELKLSFIKDKANFLGFIDRIDELDDSYIVYDYKLSKNAGENWKQWLKKFEYQMFLYSYAIENGLTALPPKKVVGCFYYPVTTAEKIKGYGIVDEFDFEQLGINIKTNKISRSAKEELFGAIFDDVDEAIANINENKLVPNPHDPKICKDCNWRRLCPAPQS